MRLSRQVRTELINLSLGDDGGVDVTKARVILNELLKGLRTKELVTVLNTYVSDLERYVKQNTMTIFHCGEVKADQIDAIKTQVERQLNTGFNVITTEDKDLIAGIRIQAGDLIIENSIASAINEYRNSLRRKSR